MKTRIFVLPTVLATLAIAGCGSSEPECPSGNVYSEGPQKGQCASKQAAESSEAQERHEAQVKKEEDETEAVIKHRAAEERADEIEGAASK
jgi:hypothetical protein